MEESVISAQIWHKVILGGIIFWRLHNFAVVAPKTLHINTLGELFSIILGGRMCEVVAIWHIGSLQPGNGTHCLVRREGLVGRA